MIRVTKEAREMLGELKQKKKALIDAIKAYGPDGAVDDVGEAFDLQQAVNIRRSEFVCAAFRFADALKGEDDE